MAGYLSEMDAETLRLIAELQLADIQAITASSETAQDGSEDATDLQSLGREIATNAAQLARDQNLAQHTIGTEQVTDSELIASLLAEENGSSDTENDEGSSESENEEVESSSDSSSPDNSNSNNDNNTTNTAATAETDLSCSFCLDAYRQDDLCKLPCGDEYCKGCILNLLEQCLKDQSLFPPRCCKTEIVLAEFQSWLPVQLIEAMETKRVEHNATDKTYCHQPTCSTFLPPQMITSRTVICPECSSETCTLCKLAAHDGDCQVDEASQQVEDLAKASGWQRCPNCRRMIELSFGCYHMTCFCGEEFCYVCAATWKNCPCAQFDEDRLYVRANEVIQRTEGPGAAPPNAEQVRNVAEQIRRNHNCAHTEWVKVLGAHQCDNCSFYAHNFIFRCRSCALEACWQCRRNRL